MALWCKGKLVGNHFNCNVTAPSWQVAGSTSAELCANFCDNILKKGGSEKLSDEAIEETLDKVTCLLRVVCVLKSLGYLVLLCIPAIM